MTITGRTAPPTSRTTMLECDCIYNIDMYVASFVEISLAYNHTHILKTNYFVFRSKKNKKNPLTASKPYFLITILLCVNV